METEYIPYTYLIGWSEQNKWYYGSRYATKSNCLYKTGCHPDDLWVTYFTSSLLVKKYRKLYGEPNVIQIRKTFKTESKCRDWECGVLVKLKVLTENSKWLNKTDTRGIPTSVISKSNKTRFVSEETKNKNSLGNKRAWSRKKKNLNYVGNRKGLIKLKNKITGEVIDCKKGEYDKNLMISLNSKFIYVSPFGNFTGPSSVPVELRSKMSYPAMLNMCVNSDEIINRQRVNASAYLNSDDIGKTPKDLGFDFIKI